MKNMQILMVAAGLGVCGAVLNFAYLTSRARNIDEVKFVAMKSDAGVNRGDKLTEDMLMPVGVPKDCVGNLEKVAVLYENLSGVVGRKVCRPLAANQLLLLEDFRTHPTELERTPGVQVMFIPVQSPGFVPSLFKPGDLIMFKVPSGPTPAAPPEAGTPPPEGKSADAEAHVAALADENTIGPFVVLSLGNRLSDADAMRTSKIPQVQENVLGIRVRESDKVEVDRANRLWNRLQAVQFRGVGVNLLGRSEGKAK